ncbi:MAG: hypothetical protein BWZ11_00869 [Bacteroidetes bacterium ADurb.BinA395]|nr:MAG: hypothetical protein BWZ11_00869 [Bacteroidetes bacterium ADurb.BinA395]
MKVLKTNQVINIGKIYSIIPKLILRLYSFLIKFYLALFVSSSNCKLSFPCFIHEKNFTHF